MSSVASASPSLPRVAVTPGVLFRLSAVAGAVAVGLVVAWWTLPRIALTDDATSPYPPLVVTVPWTLLALGAATVVAGGLLLHAWARRPGTARGGQPGRGEALS